MIPDALAALGGVALAFTVLYAAARYVGLGKCVPCSRSLPPWSAVCSSCLKETP
ncbi:hypothetical protein GA0070616_4626 [Micromonospora nigra]|uniref:Uncharacterized protein n=1 Tax=Micromonospora nigra TaxID=145857 RepID=A0A1C6SUC3_9ACTN|nr:hypothetical protein GA0070616_4626 [Micromonospora nigra]